MALKSTGKKRGNKFFFFCKTYSLHAICLFLFPVNKRLKLVFNKFICNFELILNVKLKFINGSFKFSTQTLGKLLKIEVFFLIFYT